MYSHVRKILWKIQVYLNNTQGVFEVTEICFSRPMPAKIYLNFRPKNQKPILYKTFFQKKYECINTHYYCITLYV